MQWSQRQRLKPIKTPFKEAVVSVRADHSPTNKEEMVQMERNIVDPRYFLSKGMFE